MGEPVKFEVGQVVRFALLDRDANRALIVKRSDDKHVVCVTVDDSAELFVLSRIGYEGSVSVISPTPRIGDKWTNGESVARIELASVERDGPNAPTATRLRIISDGEPFVGDVVAVARRLWEGGYRVARARSASESSADVFASMARVEAKKWSDRGALGVSNAADVRECFAAFMPRDADLSGASGAPAYLTLDDLKALVPTHAEATTRRMPTFGEMLASDPIAQALVEDAHAGDLYSRALAQADAEIKKAILGTSEREKYEWQPKTAYPREVDGVCRDELPCAGEVYQNATQTVRMLICADGDLRTQIIASSLPEPQREVARHPAAEMAEYLRERGYRRVETNPLAAAPTRWTGDRLRTEAAKHGLAPLSGETNEQLRTRLFQQIAAKIPRNEFASTRDKPMSPTRTPDILPFAALADAVASIFTTPDLATSRRYIDMAIASVRGEPFAHAIRAVLVAASDAPLSAHTIAGIVRGARSHERRRSEVAPGRRELTDAQLLMCSAAAFYDADGCWSERLSRMYERARAAG